jgi:hypothetical protein
VITATLANPNESRSVLYLLNSDKTTPVAFIVIQLDKSAGTGSTSPDQDLAYPNPTNGIIRIIRGKIFENAIVMNSSGIILQRSAGNFKEITIDLSNEPGGNYFIRLNGKDWTETVKVILVKE